MLRGSLEDVANRVFPVSDFEMRMTHLCPAVDFSGQHVSCAFAWVCVLESLGSVQMCGHYVLPCELVHDSLGSLRIRGSILLAYSRVLELGFIHYSRDRNTW